VFLWFIFAFHSKFLHLPPPFSNLPFYKKFSFAPEPSVHIEMN
jgi:hypothetical protein